MRFGPGGPLAAINGYNLMGEPSRATVPKDNRKQRSRMSAAPAVIAGSAAESANESRNHSASGAASNLARFRSRDRTDAARAQGLSDANVDPYSCSSILVWSGDCLWGP